MYFLMEMLLIEEFASDYGEFFGLCGRLTKTEDDMVMMMMMMESNQILTLRRK